MSRQDVDKLQALAELSAAMYHGRDGFEERLGEIAGGFPGGGGGGGASELDSVEAAVDARVYGGQVDVAEAERAAWERDLRKSLDHALSAWERYKRIVQPRLGVARLTDPGCELCATVPCEDPRCRCSAIDVRHWCATRYTVDIETPAKRNGDRPTVRRLRLCSSCYAFQRPDRAGRLPSHDEVLDHVEGRQRRWKAAPSRARSASA